MIHEVDEGLRRLLDESGLEVPGVEVVFDAPTPDGAQRPGGLRRRRPPPSMRRERMFRRAWWDPADSAHSASGLAWHTGQEIFISR
ncbi:hypothetical protein ACF08M_08430 [Streptomyces sp. NPDC015032]|uniref:hypothetical protein n=1 Tax=Streptomyces sp. NPDC015032 TaxID=3364937 RepID=UPI0036F592A8